jgi:hypothetical protein
MRALLSARQTISKSQYSILQDPPQDRLPSRSRLRNTPIFSEP